MSSKIEVSDKKAHERGLLHVENPDIAAYQFGELCKGDLFEKMIFNVIDTPTERHKEAVAREAVETFLARYGV